MPNGTGVFVDFVVVTSLKSLVTKEVNVPVGNAAILGLILEMLKAVSLVPTGGEDVKRDLAADREAIGVSWYREDKGSG